MERTIRVTGKGKVSLKPDRIRLTITQTGLCAAYDTAVAESADRKQDMNALFAALGFEKSDLKTLSFNVDTQYESYQDKNHVWKQRLEGYRYTHRMKIVFPADHELLGKVLYAISHCPGAPEFSIEHTVSDPEEAKQQLLARAVIDSRRKAEVLTAAAGVSLGQLLSIDYSWQEIDFVSHPMDGAFLCDGVPAPTDAKSYRMDIEADDIDVEDTVTVVWNLV